MPFNAKTFIDDIQKLLDSGEISLYECIEGYNWANVHLKELHKYHPQYTQERFRRDIKRVFNVNAELAVRAARKIGGSRSEDGMRRGLAVMKRYGYSECNRADNLLSTEQMRSLVEKITQHTTVDEFHEAVSVMAEVLEEGDDSGKVKKFDYPAEYRKLLAENARLKQQVEDLQGRIAFYERTLKVSMA